jgi:hypothetical protein
MNFYHLTGSFGPKEAFIEREESREGFTQDKFSDQPLQFAPGDLVLYHTQRRRQLTDMLGTGGDLIISPRMMAVLSQFDVGFLEFFSVPVPNTWDDQVAGYFFFHVLYSIDFIDKGNSDIIWYEDKYGGIEKVRSLSINETKLKGRNIFRSPDLFQDTFISEDVKAALEAAELTGIKFVPASEYQRY